MNGAGTISKTHAHEGFAFAFPATEIGTRTGIARIMGNLDDALLCPEQNSDIEIALTEALNNVVEHAYAGMPTGEIRVAGRRAHGTLSVTIRDAGHALPGDALPEGRVVETDMPRMDLPEGGFGWFLIHQLARDVSYMRRNDENILSLAFDI